MKLFPLFVLILLLQGILFSNANFSSDFSLPIDGKSRVISCFGGCQISDDLEGIDFLINLGLYTDPDSKEPVLAMQKGYIKKILLNDKKLGNAIYIGHDKNLTSAYTNLSAFSGEFTGLADAISSEFNTKRSVIRFAKNEFEIEQGEIIGFSGMSGDFSRPGCYVQIIDEEKNLALNPLDYFEETSLFDLHSHPYEEERVIDFERIRINFNEFDLNKGVVYPFQGDNPMIQLKISSRANYGETKLSLKQLKVFFDAKETLFIDMDSLPLDKIDEGERIFGEGSNHQNFWYRLTTPWFFGPIKTNTVKNIERFNDKIRVRIEAIDCFGNSGEIKFWLKRR